MAKATGAKYKVAFRRRRERLTDYKKRLGMIKGKTPRLVVRKTCRHIIAQFIKTGEKGDITIASANSSELRGKGWIPQSNSPTAYLVGLMAGVRAKKAGVKGFHLDVGMSVPSPGNVAYAAALGAKESGLEADVSEKMIDAKRIRGEHIAKHAKELREKDSEKFKRLFGRYLKANVDVAELPKLFDELKSKVR